ncbi:MAG: uroporphyrinogen decarboxylase family protein [Candidatus Omnitrophota bacterium]
MTAHPSPLLRERFFAFLHGNYQGRILFFPDITDWYKARRTPLGEPQRYEPGQIIYDDDPFHRQNRDMPPKFRDWTLLDFYRRCGWGCPIHLYKWREEVRDGWRQDIRFDNGKEYALLKTPIGELRRVRTLAADGSYCITEHFAKTIKDLDILLWAVRHTSISIRFDRIQKALEALDGFGVIDIPVGRSPFGTFIHDAMGLYQGIFALHDELAAVERFLDSLAEPFLQTIRAAAQTPARIVIVSDHADEYLICPPHYQKYCLPIYQKACVILHEAGKIVSTHVDGNLHGHFRLLPQTGFDLLDGCTPAPMSNYSVSELSAALGDKLYAYCGIPACLFAANRPDEEILAWAETIERESRGRMILNVGDILSPEGNIEQVIRVGEWVG